MLAYLWIGQMLPFLTLDYQSFHWIINQLPLLTKFDQIPIEQYNEKLFTKSLFRTGLQCKQTETSLFKFWKTEFVKLFLYYDFLIYF